jgi:hypothetical protein
MDEYCRIRKKNSSLETLIMISKRVDTVKPNPMLNSLKESTRPFSLCQHLCIREVTILFFRGGILTSLLFINIINQVNFVFEGMCYSLFK